MLEIQEIVINLETCLFLLSC